MDTRVQGGVVNPQQTELLNKLYNQTLSRTYINRRTGDYVMLSIAYGERPARWHANALPRSVLPGPGFSAPNPT